MSCCDYCNFKNKDDCVLHKLAIQFDEGELTEDEYQDECQNAMFECECQYDMEQERLGDIEREQW